MTIESFKHKELRKLFEKGNTPRIAQRFHTKLLELLDIIDATTRIKDMHGVSDFHGLKGDRKGEFSMHVNGNRVITFKFKDGEATDVNFEDYH